MLLKMGFRIPNYILFNRINCIGRRRHYLFLFGPHNLFNTGIYTERNIVYAKVLRLVAILHFKSVCRYHIVRLRAITIL